MVKIRLTRTGKKNTPSFRIVVSNAREKRESLSIERLGYYIPTEKKVELDIERTKYWIGVGAQPTETVKYILIKKGVLEAPKQKRVFHTKPGKKATERKAKEVK